MTVLQHDQGATESNEGGDGGVDDGRHWVADGGEAADDGLVALDLPHRDRAVRDRFARQGAFAVDALLWQRGTTASAAAHPQALLAALTFTLRPHLGWWNEDSAIDDQADIVRQVSFLVASDGYDRADFEKHYRHHVDVARRHMPSLWRYVQNDVVAVAGPQAQAAEGIVAVSELWFRRSDDFLHRYFASAQDAEEFRSHEGFLDLSRAFSFIAERHREGPR
jgi:hypothetical protein